MSLHETFVPGPGVRRILLDTGSYRFDALDAGRQSGPLALLLHGWPEFAQMWTPVIEALGSDGRHAVAVDQRGYSPGARPLDVHEYSTRALVTDVFGFADALGAAQFDLVAHDWGGIVAWIAAGVRPDRVRSLTVLAIPHPKALALARASDPDQQRRLAYIGLHVAPEHKAEHVYLADGAAKLRRLYGDRVPAAHIDDYVRRLVEPGVLTATLNWYRAEPSGDVPDCTVPTLYMWGSEDVALGERAALSTRDFVHAPYRFERLDGVSHWIADEVPDTVCRMLREHLATYSPLTDV